MDRTEALDGLTALSQATRLEVFRLLIRVGPDGLAAGEIAARLGVVQNTMSAHLGILARAGLVSPRRRGRRIEYAANIGGVRGLLEYLMQDCCQGAPEICAPLFETVRCE